MWQDTAVAAALAAATRQAMLAAITPAVTTRWSMSATSRASGGQAGSHASGSFTSGGRSGSSGHARSIINRFWIDPRSGFIWIYRNFRWPRFKTWQSFILKWVFGKETRSGISGHLESGPLRPDFSGFLSQGNPAWVFQDSWNQAAYSEISGRLESGWSRPESSVISKFENLECWNFKGFKLKQGGRPEFTN